MARTHHTTDILSEISATRRSERTAEENNAFEARKNLALLVTAARTLRGATQTRLAQMVGTTQPKISTYENGDGNPTWDTLSRIFGALGLTLVLAPNEVDVAPIPRAEYESLLHDREELRKLRGNVQQALLNRSVDTQAETISVVRFPQFDATSVYS